jgi:hypothetical protein
MAEAAMCLTVDELLRAARRLRRPPAPRVTMRDDSLPHQIVIFLAENDLAVSCNCMRRNGRHATPFAARTRWEPHEPIALWRAHMRSLAFTGAIPAFTQDPAAGHPSPANAAAERPPAAPVAGAGHRSPLPSDRGSAGGSPKSPGMRVGGEPSRIPGSTSGGPR